MRGFVEHDSRACPLGKHTNRGPVTEMCPVYLELRRHRLRAQMRYARWDARIRADVQERALFREAASR